MSEILRIVGGGVLGLICCYIGLLVKRYFADREKFFMSMCEFLRYLKGELTFKKTPLLEVVNNFLKGRKGEFEKVLKGYFDDAKGVQEIERSAQKMGAYPLKSQEKQMVLDTLSSLGKNPLDDERLCVERYIEQFDVVREDCAKKSKTQGGMYFKLFALLGLVLMVLLW